MAGIVVVEIAPADCTFSFITSYINAFGTEIVYNTKHTHNIPRMGGLHTYLPKPNTHGTHTEGHDNNRETKQKNIYNNKYRKGYSFIRDEQSIAHTNTFIYMLSFVTRGCGSICSHVFGVCVCAVWEEGSLKTTHSNS